MRIISGPVLWPLAAETAASEVPRGSDNQAPPNAERVRDQEFFSDFYPSLKALLDKKGGAFYWKGALPLIDGSRAEVLAMENLETAVRSIR